MRQRFTSYGLEIESSCALPGVSPVAAAARPDVSVRLEETDTPAEGSTGDAPLYVSPDADAAGVPWLSVCRDDDGFRFAYAEGAWFRVSFDGARIDGTWRRPLTTADAASYLLGPVLAFVLRLRGVVPLHAGAAVVGGRAILFAGAAGAGKSSTVAALGALGHPVLSDDVVPLRLSRGEVLAAPGFPRVSVWDDTATVLRGRPPDTLSVWSQSYGKRCIDLLDQGIRFHDEPVPIGAIYVLGARETNGTQSRALAPRTAMMALAANTYGAYLLDQRMRAVEFDVLGAVAGSVSVRELRLDGDLSRLIDTCAALVASLTTA
jgi:hypothetical protein